MPPVPAFPFVLVRPAGYVGGDVPTPAEIQLLQEQVAVAADGRLWSDVAILKNWKYVSTGPTTTASRSLVYDPGSRRWLVFGMTSGDAEGYYTISGARWLGAGILGGSPVLTAVNVAATGQSKVLVGGTPASGSTAKLRESSNGGVSWTTRNMGAADVAPVGGMVYVDALGLWLASQNSIETGIWSSPDAITWTKRSTLSVQCFIVRNAPTPVILGFGSGTAGTNYSYSTDGISWSSVAFPADTNAPRQGCYSEALGLFVAVSAVGGIYTSTTGLAGSWTLRDASFTTGGVAAFGRALVRGDGKVSMDAGVSWFSVLELLNNNYEVRAAPGIGVAMSRGASLELYLSQLTGL